MDMDDQAQEEDVQEEEEEEEQDEGEEGGDVEDDGGEGEEEEYNEEDYEDYGEGEEGGGGDEAEEEVPASQHQQQAFNKRIQWLDALFLGCLNQGTATPALLNALTSPDQKQLAQQAFKDMALARSLKASDPAKAFEQYMQGLDAFYKLVSRGDLQTQLERTIKVVVYEAFDLSKRVQDDEGNKAAATLLDKMRTFLARFKSQASQAVGLALCLRIGSAAMPYLKVFFETRTEKTQSNVVTIAFYQGRLAAIEGRTSDAMTKFETCYYGIPMGVARSDPHAFANKKRAFERLLPFRLIAGKYPKKKILDQFNLGWRYEPLIAAAKAGDLKTLNAELSKHHDYFLSMDCAALLSVWLNAIAKQHILRIVAKEMQTTTISLNLLAGLSCWDLDGQLISDTEDVDRTNHVLCLLSDLISRGLLKGEIVLDDGEPRLVLDRARPFPTLNSSSPRPFKISKW